MGMGGTQRSAKFVKYLRKFKWKPIVVTVKDVHYYAHDNSLLQELGNSKIIRTESFDPLRLLARLKKFLSTYKKTIPASSQNGKSKLPTFLNNFISGWLFIPDSKILWLPYALKKSLAIIREQKIAIVYTTSPPHSAHIGGLLLKLITCARWVADFRDDWTGGESQPSPSFLHTFINRLMEKFVLKAADRVIGMCDHLIINLRRKNGYSSHNNKFITIMNGYDRADFFGLENIIPYDRFTVTHCGSISRVSDPEPFLRAIQTLFQQQPQLKEQISIQFMGIDLFGRLEELQKKLHLDQNISPIKYLSHREALKELMRSHLLLLTIFKKSGEEIITGKVFEYFASGKPILMISSKGEIARIIRSLDRGVIVDNHDIMGIQKAILNYFEQWRHGEMTFNAHLSLPQFDREQLTGRLAEVFSGLSN